MSKYILSIDAGTTGVTVVLYDRQAQVVRHEYGEFRQHYPQPGWVEHDASEIWKVTLRLIRQASENIANDQIAGIGITNQRETTVLWDRNTGEPAANAIVWQCRRSQDQCERLRNAGHTELLARKSGLVPDAYFSGTKIQWLIENNENIASRARAGELAFGTIDSWLIWNLSGGALHVTDFTNASRTLLFNIEEKTWDDELLALMSVPDSLLPEVRKSSEVYGETEAGIFGGPVPICGIAGDQQAALFGQGGGTLNAAKNTYGTGCFFLVNTGGQRVHSRNGLVTTLATDTEGNPVYALEGSVFIAGAVVQWLRDELKIIKSAPESEDLAASVPDTGGVYLVPAFAGLGAPYWDMAARGGMVGITRGTGRAHITRAALESIAYQTRDLVDAVQQDLGIQLEELRVDGGATANNFLMQFQADILGIPVDRPANIETTALGAGFLAGLGCGFWSAWDEIADNRKTERRFEPAMHDDRRDELFKGWKDAVARMGRAS
ncbi:MAG: glycerol kinase GlpK [Planctomycetota bacterium]|jgi:glycerol kinase|nr:glycerol kinase GlpK [Planctomycetota bacterium]